MAFIVGQPISKEPGWYKSFGMRLLPTDEIDSRIREAWQEDGEVWAYAICDSETDEPLMIVPEKVFKRLWGADRDIEIIIKKD